MGIKDGLSEEKKADTQNASTLEEDIPKAADWVVKALNTSGYKADYSLESMKEIDRFFDEQSGPDGVLAKNGTGQILFSLGSYIGQTVIKLHGGKWITNDDDPQGEVNIAVETADGVTLWPAMRCIKRYMNGSEDSIYALVSVLDNKDILK
ncbi:MAG: hypothetical protein K2N44_12160 [Lachnospiraceae bacterium]|nr:hypothetical protein [Lachnospiraceae bacterium]